MHIRHLLSLVPVLLPGVGLCAAIGCGGGTPSRPEPLKLAAGLAPASGEVRQPEPVIPKWKVNLEYPGKMKEVMKLVPGLELDSEQVSVTLSLKAGPFGIQKKILAVKFDGLEFDWIPQSSFSVDFEVNKFASRTFSPAEGLGWEFGPALEGRGVMVNFRVGGKDASKPLAALGGNLPLRPGLGLSDPLAPMTGSSLLAEATFKDGKLTIKPALQDWRTSLIDTPFNLPESKLNVLVPPIKPAESYKPLPAVLDILANSALTAQEIPRTEWPKITAFVVEANYAEIGAYRWNDARIAEPYFHGDFYQRLKDGVADQQKQGHYQEGYLDCPLSYPVAMRRQADGTIEVDACEVWSRRICKAATGEVVRTVQPHEVWQTIIVKTIPNVGLRVTDVKFHKEPLMKPK